MLAYYTCLYHGFCLRLAKFTRLRTAGEWCYKEDRTAPYGPLGSPDAPYWACNCNCSYVDGPGCGGWVGTRWSLKVKWLPKVDEGLGVTRRYLSCSDSASRPSGSTGPARYGVARRGLPRVMWRDTATDMPHHWQVYKYVVVRHR